MPFHRCGTTMKSFLCSINYVILQSPPEYIECNCSWRKYTLIHPKIYSSFIVKKHDALWQTSENFWSVSPVPFSILATPLFQIFFLICAIPCIFFYFRCMCLICVFFLFLFLLFFFFHLLLHSSSVASALPQLRISVLSCVCVCTHVRVCVCVCACFFS